MRKIFIDTNILIYANDGRDKIKQEQAISIVQQLMGFGNGVVSTQVIQEYAAVALNKLNQDSGAVLRQTRLLESFEVVRQSVEMIRRAIEIVETYHISFWDACIISNAENAGCTEIYSEDLNTGQYYSGIRVVNPFN